VIMLHSPEKGILRGNTSDGACGAHGSVGIHVDGPLHAAIGRWTGGISPVALLLAYQDWLQHLIMSPDSQQRLIVLAQRYWSQYLGYCLATCKGVDCTCCIEARPQDKRFISEDWQTWPFLQMQQGFLLTESWWQYATTGIPGVSRHHEDMVSFVARQLLDIVSPANFLCTNPEALKATANTGGRNLLQGWRNLLDDARRHLNAEPPAGANAFEVGRNLAATPGKVVFRNRLIELIQYEPTTSSTYPEPILIVPAWIMKYYILDLSPQNSLVRYLVGQGHTVFVISWRNPGAEDRALTMEDYRSLGIMAALDVVNVIVPGQRVHAVGYCLGGTLLAIAAAAMAGKGDERLTTLTLLAAQTDFTEAGELMLFIDEAQVSFLEDIMDEQGYLAARQMAGAFQLLRSNDLIWSAMVRSYLLGERRPMFDLMAWNADATRMPATMHSEYLRRLFLDNDLADERYCVDGRPISLQDIRAPIFAVGTLADHVAPWRSVYKVHARTSADVTFVLSAGGHNAGIVNPPGRSHRHHQIATHEDLAAYVDPDAWQAKAARHEGSWWPCWQGWLARHSGGMILPPALGAPTQGYRVIADAPGTYVLQR